MASIEMCMHAGLVQAHAGSFLSSAVAVRLLKRMPHTL